VPEDKKAKQNLKNINQEFKEKELQEKAQSLGMPYINLLNFRVNPDVLSLIEEQESQAANMVVFFQIGKKLRIAISDPNNIHAKNIIQKFKTENFSINVNLASEESIHKVQELYENSLYKKEVKHEGIELNNEEIVAAEAIKDFEDTAEKDISSKKSSDVLDDFHKLAIQTNASDVHFQTEKDIVHIRFRIDGMLQSIASIDHKTYEGIARQIKMNAHLKLNVTDQPQDGQYFFNINERSVDIRVSVLPSVYGESIVMRFLDPKKGIVSLNELGFKKYSLEHIAMALAKAEGIILLTGPTGSGKTTTLYSMLDVINRPHRKIITLEDPVEYKMNGILQCEVSREESEETTLTFKDGLIATLRQDPDVIMVGEIREPEVANIAFQASMTGHLVLSTIHANSSIETLARLRNLGVNSYLIAPAINMIVSQRLLRRICPHCIGERDISKKNLEYLQGIAEKIRARGVQVNKIIDKEKFGKGCKYCNNTGYLGRITVAEIFVVSEKIRELIQAKENTKTILTQAISEGFINIKEDAVIKVLDGETTFEEMIRVVG